jgi:hypothetical protein
LQNVCHTLSTNHLIGYMVSFLHYQGTSHKLYTNCLFNENTEFHCRKENCRLHSPRVFLKRNYKQKNIPKLWIIDTIPQERF